jgi:hypothetical protein
LSPSLLTPEQAAPPFKRKQYINKLYLHMVLKVFSQDEVFWPTLSLIPGSTPGSRLSYLVLGLPYTPANSYHP